MKSCILQRVGTITKVNDDRVETRFANGEVETFKLDEIHPDDKQLLKVGAEFYWTRYSEVSPGGSLRRICEIRMRR